MNLSVRKPTHIEYPRRFLQWRKPDNDAILGEVELIGGSSLGETDRRRLRTAQGVTIPAGSILQIAEHE